MQKNRHLSRFPQLTLALLVLSLGAPAWAAKPTVLKICHSDQDESPWITLSGDGVNQKMVAELSKQINIKIETMGLPWKRCLADMEAGKVDGAFPASFKTDRLTLGAYPMTGDKPDATKRLHTEGYSLYVLKGSNIGWDGQKFSNITGSVGAPTGYSIIDLLKKNNLTVDEANKSSVDLLKKVQLGRLQAAALQTGLGDILLKQTPEFGDKITKVNVALEEKPYYLMLSNQLVKAEPALAKEIWDKVGALREKSGGGK